MHPNAHWALPARPVMKDRSNRKKMSRTRSSSFHSFIFFPPLSYPFKKLFLISWKNSCVNHSWCQSSLLNLRPVLSLSFLEGKNEKLSVAIKTRPPFFVLHNSVILTQNKGQLNVTGDNWNLKILK